jgi:Ca2+-binding EF-hand superfamily protein
MTPSRSLAVIALAALSFAAAPVLAQEATRPASPPDRDTQRRAAFDRSDANKDGFIDRSESRTARDAIFDRLDIDKDGRLSTAELTFQRRSRGQGPGARAGSVNAQPQATAPGNPTANRSAIRADRMLQRLDADKDGAVSRAEWQASSDMRFDRCDANRDGKLAFDECRMAFARTGRRPASIQ